MQATEKTLEQRILSILLAGRLLGLIVALSSFKHFYTNIAPSTNLIVYLVFFLLSLYQWYSIKDAKDNSKLSLFQYCTDILLLTLVLSKNYNPSAFSLYLIFVCATGLAGKPLNAMLVGAISGVSYGLVLSGVMSSEASRLNSLNALELLIAYGALVLASIISSLASIRISELQSSVKTSQNDLKKLSEEQSQLMNSLTEGVITLDLESAVTGINEAAKAILGLGDLDLNKFVGKDIRTSLTALGIDGVSSEFGKSIELGMEVKLNRGKEKILRCSGRSVVDHDGVSKGQVLFLSDVSELQNTRNILSFHEEMARALGDEKSGEYAHQFENCGLVGKSMGTKNVLSLVSKVAPSEAPVLILGESGTGKELVASLIHEHSKRADQPFITVNCGAIPENLIESELFGHKKGSFTGADRDVKGLFREANGGTLFLDEIGELPLLLQVKILRAIQYKVIRPVGESKEERVDVRILSATNKDLKAEVDKGNFREDLYYRLKVVEAKIPPLRDRKEDLMPLISHFLNLQGYVDQEVRISPEALSSMLNYNYPGNVRELENMIHRAIVLGGGVILHEYLPEDVQTYVKPEQAINYDYELDSKNPRSSFPVNLAEILENLEKKYLIEALNQTEGKKKEASKLLNLNFRSFRYRLKKYDLGSDEDEVSS